MTTAEIEQKATEEARKALGCDTCSCRCTMNGFKTDPWDANECEPGLFIEGYTKGFQAALASIDRTNNKE